MSDADRRARQDEIERNRAFFVEELPKIPAAQRGKFALIRRQEIIGYYDTPMDAVTAARQFDDQMYSVQEVTDFTVNLGYYSNALPLASAQ
jgi:hypothetical protein